MLCNMSPWPSHQCGEGELIHIVLLLVGRPQANYEQWNYRTKDKEIKTPTPNFVQLFDYFFLFFFPAQALLPPSRDLLDSCFTTCFQRPLENRGYFLAIATLHSEDEFNLFLECHRSNFLRNEGVAVFA